MKFATLLLTTTTLARFRPYDGEKKAGWKTKKVKVDDTEIDVIEMKDGNPVWLDANGAESVLGGDTITRLNGEAATNRKRYETAEAKLEGFKDITDPAKALEAIELVSKLDQKKLIDAGEVDRVKKSIEEQFTEKLTAADKRAEAAEKRADDTLIDNVFANSKYIADKIAVPRDMVRATFGNRFKVEDGKVVVLDTDGKTKLLSKAKQGEYADFDEGLELIVNGYSAKDAILKGGNHSGGGNQGGGGGGKPGQAVYTRDELQAKNPTEQAAILADVRGGKAVLND